jgi:tetratricopeptide (TPR) repeat protein
MSYRLLKKMSNRFVVPVMLLMMCGAAAADETWYEAYANAEKAMARQDWAAAEKELSIALQQHPRNGKNVRAYGSRFITYLPDYLLGVVYYNQGKLDRALQQFDRVEKSGILNPKDRQWAVLTELRAASARQIEARKTAAQKKPTEPPKQTAVPPAPVDRSQTRATENPQPPPPTPPASTKHEPKPAANKTTPANQLMLELRKRALRAFYLADYKQSSALFQQLASETGSAGSYFYLACSDAGLAILDDRRFNDLAAQARAHYAKAMTIAPEKPYDTRFIPPRILEILQYPGSQPK